MATAPYPTTLLKTAFVPSPLEEKFGFLAEVQRELRPAPPCTASSRVRKQMGLIRSNTFNSSSVNCPESNSASTRNFSRITFPGVQKSRKPADRAKPSYIGFAFFLYTGLFDA